MLRPLLVGVPLIVLIAGGFIAGMNLVPFSSPYFKWVIIGYAVLFPLTLAWMILSIIRGARRLIAGGDASLRITGRKAKARVIAVRPSVMRIRLNGGVRQGITYVTLRVEEPGAEPFETRVMRAAPLWSAPPDIGAVVDVHIDPRNRDNLFVAWDEAAPTASVSANLSTLPPQLQDLIRQSLDMAAASKPSIPSADPSQASEREAPSDARPSADPPPIGDAIEGRARVEGFQPWPDGTYDLDLYVTPKSRASYKVALRAAVPHGRIDDLKRGLMIDVRIHPTLSSRVEIDWRTNHS